jgi:hypothetical protein
VHRNVVCSGARCSTGHGDPEKASRYREIVLGVRDASIPFSYADNSGQSIGYSVDLCMRVVEHLRQTLKMPELKARQQLVTSANRVPLVLNGTVDLEWGSTVNNIERQKTVAFSLTTFIVNTKFITKSTSGIQKVADLKGKTVAVTGGTNTMEKITTLNRQLNLDLSIINGKDHAESFPVANHRPRRGVFGRRYSSRGACCYFANTQRIPFDLNRWDAGRSIRADDVARRSAVQGDGRRSVARGLRVWGHTAHLRRCAAARCAYTFEAAVKSSRCWAVGFFGVDSGTDVRVP